MGKKLVSKTAKVLSETKKNKDKESIAIAYEHIPRNPEEQSHGSLYAVIELSDSAGHAEEIAEGIIDSLYNEYYMDTTREPLASFEAALAKVNEDLAERSSEGQINWLGKLNAVLGVLADNTLHLSQAGKAEAYLYRAGHAMHVTDDLSGDSINPLRTFINVASGDLVQDDRLAFVTPGVFLKISKTELKHFVAENSPRVAVESLSRVLSGENGQVPNAVLVMEMVSPETYATDPTPEAPNEAWVKEDKKALEEVAEGTITGAAKIFDFMGKAAGVATAFVNTNVVPNVKNSAGKITEKIKGFQKEKTAEKIILESEDKIEVTKDSDILLDDNLDATEEIQENEKSLTGVNEFRIREEEKKPRILSLERFDFSFATNARDKLFGFLKSAGRGGGKNRKLFFIIILVIVVSATGLIFYTNYNNKLKAAEENRLAQAKTKYEQAIGELASGRKEAALETLEIAKKLATEVKGSGAIVAENSKLLADIESAIEQANGIIKNSANEFYNFDNKNLGNIFTNGTLIYALDYKTGSVYALDPKSKSKALIVSDPGLDSPIKYSTFISTRSTIVVYTENKKLYEIDLVAKRASEQSIVGGVETAIGMASYGTNVYLLSATESQIFKHLKISGGYTSKQRYFTGSDGIGSGVNDFAIDSSIYVLGSNGLLQKFTSGSKVTYTIKGLPSQLPDQKRVYADPDVAGQYLFSADRVVKVDQSGNFVAQYIDDKAMEIKNLFVVDATKTIYALSGGKIYTTKF